MSLEFSEKVRGIREAFGLTQKELAEILGIDRSVIAGWETLAYKAADCWERVIQFLIDCPSSALSVLRQKPWVNDQIGWPDRIINLRQTLGWTRDRFGEFLSTHGETLNRWIHGSSIEPCYQILMALLEIYSGIDPKEWPPALYLPEEDIITPERIKLLRLGFGMKQSQLANLIHVTSSIISTWETGHGKPGWCANLLLKMLETYPRAADLLEKMPWGDDRISPERAMQVRTSLGLTRLEMAHLLGATSFTINTYEDLGDRGADCGILVYQLLEQHAEEFISYIKDLSSPGGQACPIW